MGADEKQKAASKAACSRANSLSYRVDSISNPQASRSGSGIYLEFLFRRAHSRKRVERRYWSGVSLNSRTTCSNSVMVGVTGPIGSGLPQLGLPLLFAMEVVFTSAMKLKHPGASQWKAQVQFDVLDLSA